MLMKKEVNCHSFKGLFVYLMNHYGKEGVQQVVGGLVDNDQYLIEDKYNPGQRGPILEKHLTDPAYWVSYDFSLALFSNVKRFMGGPNPLFAAGEGAVLEYFSKSALFASRLFGTGFLAKRAPKINARFNRNKEVRLLELAGNSAIFELCYFPEFQANKDVCNWNLGVYTGIAKATGVTGVQCRETQCAAEGDPCCVFHLSWKPASIFRRIVRWVMKSTLVDLIDEYEDTVRDRDHLIDRLTESERRYRALYDYSPVETIIVDRQGKVTGYNPAKRRSGGRLPDVGDVMFGDYAAKQENDMFEELMDSIRTGTLKEFPELKYEDRFFQTRISPFPEGAIIASNDITRLKRTEEALRLSEDKYRTILESIEDGYYEVDHKGSFTFFNDSVCRILGYSKNELEGMGYRDFIGREHADKLAPIFERAHNAGGRSGRLDLGIIRKDGTRRFIEVSASLVKDASGQLLGYRGIARDISDRKQAEEALRRSEEKARSLINAITETVVLMDREGTILDANSVAASRLGKPLHELAGKCLFDLFPPGVAEGRRTAVEKVFRTGKPLRTKDTRDGKTYDINWYPISKAPGVVEMVVIFATDITERRALETQLQQARKIEAIGTLAGGIAHDFNNLLMGIQGRTSLMLMGTASSHPFIDHLKGIEEHVASAVNLTRQLLGFARGGKYEVKTSDLNEIVRKTSEMFGRTKKEITIHSSCREDLRPVDVDRGQIEQVMLNLYVNAWQAMPDGGTLHLETENIDFQGDDITPYPLAPGRYVRISVTDTGVGMDRATRERIFDPFFTTKGRSLGTGLGLASAYGIIRNHGGLIDVSSSPGEGTTFRITLPASDREIREEAEPVEEILKGTETVLLVDDEEMILDVGRKMLEALGYVVIIAASGEEALEIYKGNLDMVDIVVLDMIMPEMGGSETFDRLRQINPRVKALLSSGYSVDGQAREILERGCQGFIQKPFKMVELSQKVREVLDGDRDK
jgi:two-component system cell cycle sensor histidine kinase/response regulator CckA